MDVTAPPMLQTDEVRRRAPPVIGRAGEKVAAGGAFQEVGRCMVAVDAIVHVLMAMQISPATFTRSRSKGDPVSLERTASRGPCELHHRVRGCRYGRRPRVEPPPERRMACRAVAGDFKRGWCR
ncbi:hypothetical protein PT931_20595 [Longispora urticae]